MLDNEMTVYLVIYDKAEFTLPKELFSSITQYIDDNYIKEPTFSRIKSFERLYEAEENYKEAYDIFSKKHLPRRKAKKKP